MAYTVAPAPGEIGIRMALVSAARNGLVDVLLRHVTVLAAVGLGMAVRGSSWRCLLIFFKESFLFFEMNGGRFPA